MLIREKWVTWKNVSHQSLFPMIAVESNTSEVYNNAPSHLDASRILVLTAGSPVRTNVGFMHKKNDAVQMPYNTLIENLFPLASTRQGIYPTSAKSGRNLIPSSLCPILHPTLREVSGNVGCEAKERDGSWSQAAKQCHLGVSHRDSVFCIT